MFSEPLFAPDPDNEASKGVVDKIVSLSIEDRIWPNCLGRPVRNASPVDVAEWIKKGKFKEEGETSEIPPVKTVANRTRSKVNVAISRASSTPETLSSDSHESPKTEKGLEMSSGRIFAKGILYSVKLLSWCFILVLVVCFLLLSFSMFTEYKTPAIKPPEMSTKEMFAKRARDERSVGTGSSKTPLLASPVASPEAKRVKPTPSEAGGKSSSTTPLIFFGYNAHANPAEFAHYLGDLLLPQYIESSNGKSPKMLLAEATGYSFHVSLLLLNFSFDVGFCVPIASSLL